MDPNQTQSPLEKLSSGATLTENELNTLRKSVDQMNELERSTISDAVDTYAQKNKEALKNDVETESALLALKTSLMEKNKTAGEKIGEDVGKAIGKTVETTINNTTNLAYDQWTKLMHPNESWQDKTLRVLGLLAVGYGLYRAASWVLDRKSSWGTKVLKFIGVTALAGWIVNRVTKNEEARNKIQETTKAPAAKETPKNAAPRPTASGQAKKKAVTTPAPVKKTKQPTAAPKTAPQNPAPAKKPEPTTEKVKPTSILKNVPTDINLVGKEKHSFNLDGKEHTIGFKADGIYIDDLKYLMTAIVFGPDPQLTIMDVRVTDGKLHFKAGAFGKNGTVSATGEELEAIVRSLVSGRPYKNKTEDGTQIEISRQMY